MWLLLSLSHSPSPLQSKQNLSAIPWLSSGYLPAFISPITFYLLFWNTANFLGMSWTITHLCLCHNFPNWMPSLYLSIWQSPMTLWNLGALWGFLLGMMNFRDKEIKEMPSLSQNHLTAIPHSHRWCLSLQPSPSLVLSHTSRWP